MSAEEVTEIEFNGMVLALKRVAEITNSINEHRTNRDLKGYYDSLVSYHYEIIADMTTTEEENSKKYFKQLSGLINSNLQAEMNKHYVLKLCQEWEEIIRKASKRAGYLTKNIKHTKLKVI